MPNGTEQASGARGRREIANPNRSKDPNRTNDNTSSTADLYGESDLEKSKYDNFLGSWKAICPAKQPQAESFG
jgi:hypothetical protein